MRREHWPFIVAIAGLFGGGMVLALLRQEHAEALDHFGGYLAGLSAFIGVAFAAIKGSQEFDDWKNRKRHEKESEVAGQVIVAAASFAEALLTFSIPTDLIGDPVHDESQKWGSFVDQLRISREERVAPKASAYGDARKQAEAYLPDDAVIHVRKLWELYRSMSTTFAVWAAIASSTDTKNTEFGQPALMKARQEITPTTEALIAALRKHTIGERGR